MDNHAATSDRDSLSRALARVAEGSQAALAEVYQRTSAKLFGICLRILGDRSEAEDALQDIYINVWRKAGSFDPARASPITWLAALARNRSIDRRRAGGKRETASVEEAAEIPDGSADALTLLTTAEDSTRIAACLHELEERQNGAIRAAFFDGLSYPELAVRWAVPLGTLKSWIRRGLLRLKDCLER
ncbi:MAG TPA: sigma-70 family RNA polymerase sigma factor [Allosphingosinicella sp.]